VETKAQAYEGPHLDRAPDLLVTWTDAVVREGVRVSHGGREIVVTQPCAEDLRHGNHRREGLLIVAGPDVAQGTAASAAIADLAPTFLALLGVPPPDRMDGRVLQDLLPGLQATVSTQEVAPGSAQEAYTAEEEALIEERLKDLGYL